MGELAKKWDTLTDAQQSNIAYNVAATRQTNTFKGILDSFADSMDLATKATNINGVANATQEKYIESIKPNNENIKLISCNIK